MEFRKIRDAADAENCLRAAVASGLPRPLWARANGIDARSLNVWRLIQARKSRPAPTALRMVELAGPPSAGTAYVVCVGRFRVELGDDFHDATLRRLLSVVASC